MNDDIISCERCEEFMRHFRNYLTDAFSGELEKCSLTIPKEFILNHDAYSAEKIGRFFFATTALLRREKI